MTTTLARPTGDLQNATRATYAAFIWSGVAMASWATRIPQVRDELGLEPSQLGLVLLAIAGGSITSLVLSGNSATVDRFRALVVGGTVGA